MNLTKKMKRILGTRSPRRRRDARDYRRFYVNTYECAENILRNAVGTDGYEIFRTPSDVADFDFDTADVSETTCYVDMAGFPERDQQRPLFELVGKFKTSVVVCGIDPREYPGAPLEKAVVIELLHDDVWVSKELVKGKWKVTN